MRGVLKSRGLRSALLPCTFVTRMFWILSSVLFGGVMLNKWWHTPSKIVYVESDEALQRMLANSLQPVILLWTKVWFEDADQLNAANVMCESVRIECTITSDRSAMTEAAALLFHARDVYLIDLPPKVNSQADTLHCCQNCHRRNCR